MQFVGCEEQVTVWSHARTVDLALALRGIYRNRVTAVADRLECRGSERHIVSR